MKQPVKNAANESQVKEAGNIQRRKREQEIADICAILATASGRRFVWRYLSECGVFALSFHNSGSQMSFNEGQRNVGLKLLADVNDANPESYLMMMKEAKEGV